MVERYERSSELAPQSLALPSRNLKRLKPELEQVSCQRAQVLMDADSALNHVFFPDSGVVSVVAVYADGSIIEMATIGREGCSGVQAVLGAKRSSVQLLRPNPRERHEDVARSVYAGHAVNAVLPKSHGRLRPRPFSNRSWCRWRATVRTASSSG